IRLVPEGRMAAPPVESGGKISMVVEEWTATQTEQFSAVHRINGYPWRLKLFFSDDDDDDGKKRYLELICDISSEAELWQCTAAVKTVSPLQPGTSYRRSHYFASWYNGGRTRWANTSGDWKVGDRLEMEIVPDDGERWRVRPILYPSVPLDGILVVGEEKRKIHVNKKSLASQSPFFDRLFYSDFMDKNMNAIRIGDVEYKEFSNIYRMIYGFDGASLSDENVRRVEQLADRFELKIVEDRVVSFVLSDNCSFSQIEKLMFAEHCNIPFMRDKIISKMNDELEELSESPLWFELSKETMQALMKQCILTKKRMRILCRKNQSERFCSSFVPYFLYFF
ncbi:hypothetical protein PMAYCL1PPCAC_08529, partial [Pristionchus mayeri]